MEVCKNKFAWHVNDKIRAFEWQFVHGGGASSVILRTQERAAHVVNVAHCGLSAVYAWNYLNKYIFFVA